VRQQSTGRRECLSLISAGVLGAVAGCGEIMGGNEGSNDILIWIRSEDTTATLTIEKTPDGEILFEKTETYEELPYPDVGPNERYENVFGTETVQITFDITDGPERTQKFSDQESSEVNITYYDDSIDIRI